MKTLVSFVLFAVIAAASTADGLACGEKFFVPGRGARFLPTPAERQAATVLLYAPPASALSQTLARLKAEAALRKAGYRPIVSTTPDDLKARAATSWDVVLISTDDGGVVRDQMPPATNQTHLIAIMEKPTAVQLARARDEFPAVLKSPSRNQDLLDAIDQATAHAIADRAKVAKGR